jgi:hypothetical protein
MKSNFPGSKERKQRSLGVAPRKLSKDGEANKTTEPVDEYTGSEAKGLSGPP